MPVMSRLRVYHALLAVLVIAAYFSSEWGAAHAWLGYGVVVMIGLRLILALTGAPQLGLMRFYPQFQGLKLDNAATHPVVSRVLLVGIALCLIGVSSTGIFMDQGRSLSPQALTAPFSEPSEAGRVAPGQTGTGQAGKEEDEDEGSEGSEGREGSEGGEGEADEAIKELHETFGNGLMLLVGLHVAYLLLFKRPLARFMLFLASVKPARPRP